MPKKSAASDSDVTETPASVAPNGRTGVPLSGIRVDAVIVGSCGAPGVEDSLEPVVDRETAARLARPLVRGASPADG